MPSVQQTLQGILALALHPRVLSQGLSNCQWECGGLVRTVQQGGVGQCDGLAHEQDGGDVACGVHVVGDGGWCMIGPCK